MLLLEYDWTAQVYRARFGDTFIDIQDVRSFPSLSEAKSHLKACGLRLAGKTDTRTWRIQAVA